MLKLVLPKGSLERATLQLFEEADLPVARSSAVDYKATISDPRVAEVRILRPQEIGGYVSDGLFDMGITGRDWIEETSANVISLGEMKYSKNTSKPVQIVIGVPEDSPWQSAADMPSGVKVSTEYPELTRRYFERAGIEADIRLSYGATEAKAPDIVDVVVDITETGRALRAAGLRILDTILTSYTELVVNPESYDDPTKRKAMGQIKTLLDGVLDARGRVLVKMNVPTAALDSIIELLPSAKMPTVNELFGGAGYAVETVVAKNEINILIPELRERGASDILEMGIAKIVP
ncbi:MAG: ATP phosphoribosyltransferase [Actinomycetia bacterium]|nr:ATP phosphoribosyltransferase [Actinomycetes bacterium]MCP4961313.1 ATP phosphoribosyltransferase [Actinomycetes bacterium]